MMGDTATGPSIPNRRRSAAFRSVLANRSGAAARQFAFVLGLMAGAVTAGYAVVGDTLTTMFTGAAARVELATNDLPNPLAGGAFIVAGSVNGNGGGNSDDNGGGAN